MKKLFALSLLALATASQAHITIFQGTFAPEVTGATGTGKLTLEYDEDGHTLLINATWSGLSGTTTNAHIHCCTPTANLVGTGVGVALAQSGRLPGFVNGLSAGTYSQLINLAETSQYSGGFVTASGGTALGAETRLMQNLRTGNAYFNIHTTTYGSGEIRAFVTAVPEPGTYAMMLAGLGMLGWAAKRRQKA